MSEFLAEAQVLITPNTTAFRTTLVAELAAATRGVTVPIPVVAAVASTAAITSQAQRSARAAADALQVQGAAAKEASASARDLARAQGLAGVAGNKLAAAQGAVANAASAVGAAQITATRSTAAVTAAQRALDAALRSQDVALIGTARNTLALAEAQAVSASAALAAARAQAAHAASFGGISKGAGSAAASLLGVRGATLAASASFLAGAAAIVLFTKAVQSAAALESELSVFQVTAGATADEMARVAAEARVLGRDIRLPGVASRDAAEAMSQLARAGLEVEDSIAGARGVLQLAAAAQISNAEATELAASALNAFQLSGDEAVHVADILATSANEAQGSITDMGIALRQSAAIADLVGLSLEDTAGLLTILARAGLRGSDAGTSFRVVLQRLIAPTKAAAAALEPLNLDLRDSQENLRPEVFFELGDALGELSVKQRQATLVTIFGADASRAAALLGREQLSTLRDLQKAYEEQGSAAELAAARNVGLTGQMSALSSNLETLGTSLGQIATPALTVFVGKLNETVTVMGETVEAVVELSGGITNLGRSFLDAIPGASKFAGVLGDIVGFTFGGPLLSGARAVKIVSDRFSDSAGEIGGDARTTARDVEKLFASFQEAGGGPTALNEMVLALDEMADKLAKGDAEAIRLGRELREVIREVQEFGNLPPSVIDIRARLDREGVRKEALTGGELIIDTMTSVLSPAAARALGFEFLQGVGTGMKEGASEIAIETSQVLIQSLGTQLAVAEATGAGDQELLGILREREAKQAAFLDRMLNRPQTKAVQQTIEKAARNLEATRSQIQSILDQQASDAKAATVEVVRAQSEADQAFLDSLSGREGRLQNKALAAAAREGLQDDIRTNTALRNFYRASIAEARETLRDAKVRAQTIVALTRDLIAADKAVKDAKKAQSEAAEEAAQDRRDERQRALELNLEFAEITDNKAAQKRALNALIKDLETRIAGMKGLTNKERELRNELARRKEQLKELKDEAKETNTFAQQTFDFMQKQEGFAANLLGNLIPGFATAGLVGGQTPGIPRPDPGAQLNAVAATKQGGPTFGQAATEVDILKQIHQVLRAIAAGRAAPEAGFQRAQMSAVMDITGGGGQAVN